MKYVVIILFCLLNCLAFSQGAGIRYLDSIPDYTPNPALHHAIVVYNTNNDTYYHYRDGKWKDLGILRQVDSSLQIMAEQYSLGERIINKQTGEQFIIQEDSFFIVDSIYAVPAGDNYAVWQPGFNHQGEFVLDTIDHGDYKLQINGPVSIKDGNSFITINDVSQTLLVTSEGDLYSVWELRGGEGSELILDGMTQNANLGIGTNTSTWYLTAYQNNGNFDIAGTVGDFRIRTAGGVYPFVIKDNAIDSAFTINAQGEALVNQRVADHGDYKLQVNGHTYIDDGTAIITFEDGTLDVDGVTNNGFIWTRLRGEQGAELDIDGRQQTSTIGLFNNDADWFINNNITTGHLDIIGSVGDFRIRTSANVYPFVVKDNAIHEAFTIKANGVLNTITIPEYADEAAAVTGGLATGDLYRTATGELRIKL